MATSKVIYAAIGLSIKSSLVLNKPASYYVNHYEFFLSLFEWILGKTSGAAQFHLQHKTNIYNSSFSKFPVIRQFSRLLPTEKPKIRLASLQPFVIKFL
jgi:hypothetical protein